ncbi:MAG: radical SAM protein [Chloroflexi bacterium]|nr:radical SAM protein [Chloroflexota bacterium]
MIHEIQAKTLLSAVKQPDPWFGLKYNMNLYRGCQHQCIYCDSRSECYGIENFSDVLVKVNAIDLLRRELSRKRVKGMVGTGSMSDPYTFAERQYRLTGQALEVIAQFRFPVHLITKSDMVLKDIDTLDEINRVHAVVSFSLTTADDDLAARVEPGAPRPSQRLVAMRALSERGIHAGVVMMPILPLIQDSVDNIVNIVRLAQAHGASYIIPAFGVTLRDRQRSYYYDQLDRLFPGLRRDYERRFGIQYFCPASDADRLRRLFDELCDQYGIATQVPRYEAEPLPTQLSLL